MFSRHISLMFQLAAVVLGDSCVAFGQITQDKPGLCGKSEFVPVPGNVVANSSGVFSTFTVTPPGAATGVDSTISGRVDQVCPIASGRYLVFAWTVGISYKVVIVNGQTGTMVDKLHAYDPAVSADQHWLVYRAFYAPHGEVPFSEEYLLYDLTKGAAENAVPNPPLYTEEMRGRVIYPAVADGRPFERAAYALSDNQMHVARSFATDAGGNSFYWSSDSTAVLFADSVQDALSIVLVVLDASGPRTLVHRVTPEEACEQGSEGSIGRDLMLSEGEVDAKGQVVQVRFRSGDQQTCRPKVLVLSGADFGPAALEVHRPIVRTGIPVQIERPSRRQK